MRDDPAIPAMGGEWQGQSLPERVADRVQDSGHHDPGADPLSEKTSSSLDVEAGQLCLDDRLLCALLSQGLQASGDILLKKLESDQAKVVRSEFGWILSWQAGRFSAGIPLQLTIVDGPVTRVLNLALQSVDPPRLVFQTRPSGAVERTASLPQSGGCDDLLEIPDAPSPDEAPAWSPLFGVAGEMASAELPLQVWMEEIELIDGARVCIAGLPDGATLSGVSGVLFSSDDCFKLPFEELEGLQISMPADLAGFRLELWGIDADGEAITGSRLDLRIIVQSSLDGNDVVYGEVLRFTGNGLPAGE